QPASTDCDDGNVCNGGEDKCNGGGRCVANNEPNNAPFNTTCDNGVWCDGEDICDGNGNCIGEPNHPCASNPECNNQCNELEHNCFSDAGTLCSQGECTGLFGFLFIKLNQPRKWYMC